MDSDLQVLIEKERKSELLPRDSPDLAPPGSKVARFTKVDFR